MRSNNPATIAFAQALLQGEDIACFELDVNMSALEGSIGAFSRRLMVREGDYVRAERTIRDNGIPAVS